MPDNKPSQFMDFECKGKTEVIQNQLYRDKSGYCYCDCSMELAVPKPAYLSRKFVAEQDTGNDPPRCKATASEHMTDPKEKAGH